MTKRFGALLVVLNENGEVQGIISVSDEVVFSFVACGLRFNQNIN